LTEEKFLNSIARIYYKIKKMKTTILLFALIFGYLTPAYSQLNHHRKTDTTTVQFQIKKIDEFGNIKFVNKFGSSVNLGSRHAPTKFTEEIHSRNVMPCFQPKSGDDMPCSKPKGSFPMRVFKPKNVIWGILL
jgi:hypothetical protein